MSKNNLEKLGISNVHRSAILVYSQNGQFLREFSLVTSFRLFEMNALKVSCVSTYLTCMEKDPSCFLISIKQNKYLVSIKMTTEQ